MTTEIDAVNDFLKLDGVRFLFKDGLDGPTFDVVAKDVVECVGTLWKGTDCIRHVPQQWRGVRSVRTPSGTQEIITLSEEGLFFYLSRSDKPAALSFQMKVNGEILPQIRRTGSYSVQKQPQTLEQRALGVITELKTLCDKQQVQIEAAAPKVDFYDQYADATGFIGLQNAARVFKQPPNKFIRRLKVDGTLFKQGGYLVPYAPYLQAGYFKVKTTVVDAEERRQTGFTPKGMQWMAKRLNQPTQLTLN